MVRKRIIEGELRCIELDEYLKNLNAPRKVWLCEDASGINPKVTFDSLSNQLIGLVLPMNQTGMPISFSFTPQTLDEIENQIQNNEKSTLVYMVIALPIMDNTAPFILQVFGTDNRFKAQDVFSRWRHIKDQLAVYVFFYFKVYTQFWFNVFH